MKSLELKDCGVSALETRETREIEGGGLTINLFGIVHIHGVLDGKKGNTTVHWSWKH